MTSSRLLNLLKICTFNYIVSVFMRNQNSYGYHYDGNIEMQNVFDFFLRYHRINTCVLSL